MTLDLSTLSEGDELFVPTHMTYDFDIGQQAVHAKAIAAPS